MRQAGFTLLELLVALTVMGFILIGLASGASFGVRATGSQARLSEGKSDLDAVDRTLRRLIAEADPKAPLRGSSGTIALVSELPAGPGLAPQQADIGLGVDGRGRLILRWTKHFPGQLFGPPPAPQEEVLLTGLRGIDLSYWSAAGAGAWTGGWNRPTLPSLVRIRIAFPEGDPRHWPDLVIAPMRQTTTNSPASSTAARPAPTAARTTP